jgi:hypothetical protein
MHLCLIITPLINGRRVLVQRLLRLDGSAVSAYEVLSPLTVFCM